MKKKSEMLAEVLSVRKLIGNTPLIKLGNPHYNLYAKLEYTNFSGSIKDRAVNNILYHGILNDSITPHTTVIESSSGNFALSAALHCNRLGIDFIAVVDPNINDITLKMLELFATKVIMVDEPDSTGGYLLNRIKKVQEIASTGSDHFWTNQYQNEYNYKAYSTLADEIKRSLTSLDYMFVSVSSCGAITGLSQFIKEQFPHTVVVAIDIQGSLIFSDQKKKRYISGLGAGQKSSFLDANMVDEVMLLSHEEIISGCNNLLRDHSIFAGGSSGACYYGATKFLNQPGIRPDVTALIVCPDRGICYLDNIYNEGWARSVIAKETESEMVKI